jgi:hypothetical protein
LRLLQAAGILILLSLQDFYQEKYFTFLSVKNDDSEFLPMQIDILFFHLPCEGSFGFIQHWLLSSKMNWSMWSMDWKVR